MPALQARVKNGRIVVDEQTELPEGTVLELVMADSGDELDDDERAQLHAALDEGLADLRSGAGIGGDELMNELLSRG